jgi:hypothetical protein
VDGRLDQVDERRGTRCGARELDRGGAGEGRGAGGQVELDVVRRDVEERGSGLRFVPAEVGSRHAEIIASGQGRPRAGAVTVASRLRGMSRAREPLPEYEQS